MKFFLYGAGKIGKEALLKVDLYKMSIDGFIDQSVKDEEIQGTKVFRLNEIDDKDATVIICISNSNIVVDVYTDLKKAGFKKIFFYDKKKKSDTDSFIKDYCYDCSNWGDAVLPQAEIHLSDYCNLNCKGCAHYSPIFEKKLPDLESRLKDIELVADKFSHVIKFFLLGGEPFLNPDIDKYITFTRKKMPDTIITIVTNGLLIDKLDDRIWNCIKENNIFISISEYEPTHKKIDNIIKILKEKEINYDIRQYDRKQEFNKPLTINPDTKLDRLCISSVCTNVWNGKIARCPSLMYIDKFNEVFKTNLPNTGIIDLNADMSAEEILEKLREDIPLCKHCVKNPIPWESCGNRIDIADFATNE